MGLLNAMDSPEMGLAMGLLSAGGPSRMPISLGQGLAQGYQGYQQAQLMQQQQAARRMQEQMQSMQLQEAQRRMTQQQSQEKFINDLIPTLPAEQQAIARAFPDQFASALFKEKAQVFDKVDPSKFDPASVAKFSKSRDYSDLVPIEKQGAKTELEKLIDARDRLPQGDPSRKMFDQAISKVSTHAPPIQVQNFPAPMPALKPDGTVGLIQFGNKGTPMDTGFKPAPVDKPLSEAQANANIYAKRGNEAHKILSDLEGQYSRGAVTAKVGAESIPVLGGLAGVVGNAMLSKEGQMAEQAQRDFVNAVLRKESGAAISQSEFNNAKRQYFPQPGDSPEVVEQKRVNRITELEGLREAVGPTAAGMKIYSGKKSSMSSGGWTATIVDK